MPPPKLSLEEPLPPSSIHRKGLVCRNQRFRPSLVFFVPSAFSGNKTKHQTKTALLGASVVLNVHSHSSTQEAEAGLGAKCQAVLPCPSQAYVMEILHLKKVILPLN